MRLLPGLPDWRDSAAYQPLLQAGQAAIAWEWLRRQPEYRAAALKAFGKKPRLPLDVVPAQAAALRWGLHFFEDPDLAVPRARPVWASNRHCFLLSATAVRSLADGNALLLQPLLPLATVAIASTTEHLLLSDGFRSVRLDLKGASIRAGPVRLRYEIEGLEAASAPLLVLRQLQALAADGRFSSTLHRPARKAGRLLLLLRTIDALGAGASQRAIAAELLGDDARQPRWRVEAPSLRSQVQRLVRDARHLSEGAFWNLLR